MSQNFNGPVTVDGNEIFTKPASGIAKSDLASDVQTSLGKADTALQSFTETDPTVPSWAKAANKPTYTYSEVGAAASSHTHTKSQITDFPTLATVATSGSYTDLSNKPTIPAAVTESTVSGWGFTKNTGTVSSLSDLGINATAAELNVLDGITATTTELNYTDGVTSNIQTQLNGKLGTSAKAADSDKLDGNDSSYFATASALANKADKASVTGATNCKITYNSQGIVTAGTSLSASDIPNLAASKITSGTFADARIASASTWNAKQDALPTTSTAGKVLKSTATAGTVEWGDASGGGTSLQKFTLNISLNTYANALRVYNIIHNAKGKVLVTLNELEAMTMQPSCVYQGVSNLGVYFTGKTSTVSSTLGYMSAMVGIAFKNSDQSLLSATLQYDMRTITVNDPEDPEKGGSEAINCEVGVTGSDAQSALSYFSLVIEYYNDTEITA